MKKIIINPEYDTALYADTYFQDGKPIDPVLQSYIEKRTNSDPSDPNPVWIPRYLEVEEETSSEIGA